MAMVAASIGYLASRVVCLLPADLLSSWGFWARISMYLGSVLALGAVLAVCIDIINAMICLLYLALIWGATDLVFGLLHKVFHISVAYPYIGLTAVLFAVTALSIGWYLNHHVVATYYQLTTQKEVAPFRVVMFADSHIGTTFDAAGFEKNMQMIQAQKPDAVFVVGDYVDDNTSREDMIKSTQALGRLNTKVYFVMGNHDKGYFRRRTFTKQELIDELQKAGVTVLQDEVILADRGFYIIGRQDASVRQERIGQRLSMAELTAPLDNTKYKIVLDHQPTDYAHQGVADLVLSGHTHGGQLFPFNQVGKWIGANDLVYGHLHQGNTDFIVTSGLSSWGIRFKTGTKSEFVVIDVMPQKK